MLLFHFTSTYLWYIIINIQLLELNNYWKIIPLFLGFLGVTKTILGEFLRKHALDVNFEL